MKFLLRLFFPLLGLTQAYAAPLATEINHILHTHRLNGAAGIYVKSLSRGDTLYSYNIHRAFIPASTQKIMTAEAALLYLGPNYRFQTQLSTDAKSIKNGVLQGNLYVVQTGDPTLTYSDLTALFQNLQTQHIRAINGNIYIDNTAYDQRFYAPGFIEKDKGRCWGAPISASIINHNCLNLKITPTRLGSNAALIKSTHYFYPPIHNTVLTKSKRTRACFLRLTTKQNQAINLNGCIPKGRFAWGVSYVVTDIPNYNYALFKNLLHQFHLAVYGRIKFGQTPHHHALIATHYSKPLSSLVGTMLKRSDNIIAGALFKKLGQIYTHQPGTWENGALATRHILATRAGVGTFNLKLIDGSGISHANLATPAQLMQVLTFAYRHSTRNEFVTGLPIAGIDGTLKHRMGHLAHKIRAKTGTISGVVSLAGYATSKNHEQLAFVIVFNGNPSMKWRHKVLEEKIATALTHFQR